MSSWRVVLIRILALLQRKTLIETRKKHIKMLKWHYWTVRADGVRGISPLFSSHPGGFDSSRVPTPGNLPSKAKKMLMPGAGQPGGGGGGGWLGAAGIDWCITKIYSFTFRCFPRHDTWVTRDYNLRSQNMSCLGLNNQLKGSPRCIQN